MLNINSLSCQIGNNTILSDINLKLEVGKSLCLFGKNGSGKTTLLRCISDIIPFQDGTIELFGAQQNERTKYFSAFGCFFFEGLYDYLTVQENYMVFLAYYGVKRKELTNVIAESVAAFELDELLNKKVKTLSAGQKQRVGLALTFMHKPKLLLFDEPLNNLDAHFIQRFYQTVEAYLLKEQAMAIIVNHDVSNTPTWIDNIGLIESQQLQIVKNDKVGLDYFLTKIHQK